MGSFVFGCISFSSLEDIALGKPAYQDLMGSKGIAGLLGFVTLLGKSFVLSTVTADVVALSETHLTKHSRSTFYHSLKSAGTGYTHYISGAPVPPRSQVSEARAWNVHPLACRPL